MSTELSKFVADFESKILQPIREKRAISDEILVIRPVAVGNIRDPQWEGVIDGEVCGLGPIAKSVQTFLHWVAIKLETTDALRLCVSCGDALAREGEFSCARDHFYRYVIDICAEIDHTRSLGGATETTNAIVAVKAEGGPAELMGLAPDEACWAARAEFGLAALELRLALTRDAHVQFPATLSRMTHHFKGIQRGMGLLLGLPKEEHEAVSWLVLDGSVLLFDWCEPLTALGYGGTVAEFLVWGMLALESVVNLSTVKHLSWRTRLAAATCHAFENAGNPEAAARCAAHAMEKVKELRSQEGMDPPIPSHVVEALDLAEGDVRLLTFKYATLAKATAKRLTNTDETVHNGNSKKTDGDGDQEQREGESLSGEDVCALLDQHIPDAKQRPAALLELLGGARCRTGVSGILAARDVSTVCKIVVPMLLPAENTEDAEETEADAARSGGAKVESTEVQETSDAPTFPLDIDQEMQLMREMYQLGEFISWGALLPHTKQRLRDAEGLIPREDSRAFWFEIALWSACSRLPTWKDKPESQASSRGGLKRSSPLAAATPSSPVDNNTTVAAVPAGNETGDDARGEGEPGKSEAGQAVLESGSHFARGTKGSMSVIEEEEELRDALSRSRQAEVVEIDLEGRGGKADRINLSPLLTVVDLVRKGLFGSYRHVLERRGDSVLEATVLVWNPYVESILRAIDRMPAVAEIDRSLLDAMLLSLETIHACMSALNADDARLRATVALRLGILQADFRGDHRKACQILRSALAGVDSYRQNFTSHHLNIASTIANDSEVSNNSDDRRRCLALARSSVSASFQDETYFAASLCGETGFVGDDDNKNTVGDGADETSRQQHLGQDLDVKMDQQGLHELSALQLDITSTLFRVELMMGRYVACRLARHQKAEAAAKLAARNNASKRRESSKVSKVTFGDSDGRFDTQAGSLTLGWSVQHHITGGGGEQGNKALQGTNAVVCAAGAGPLPSVTAAAARQRDLGSSLVSAIEGIDLPNLKDVERQVESCCVTEARLVSEFRRNPYARAILVTTMARFRTDRTEQEALFKEAVDLLRQARSTEETLLRFLPPNTSRRGGQASQASPSRRMQDTPHSTKDKRAKLISTPAPPLLLSRSHTCIELLPPPFPPQSRENVNDDSASGSIGSDGRKLNRASNSTSSRANPTRYEETQQNAIPRVAKVCVYGKPEGAGTGVTLSNTHYAGLGVPIPYDAGTGLCGSVSIRGLVPNESYVFAVAAFDESGNPIGDGIGGACAPVQSLNPLPLPLCWAHLSRTALGMGWPSLAGQAAKEVYRELMSTWASPKPSPAQRGCCDVEEGNNGGGRATTKLCDGWMANPLHGHAFCPRALDRCPRGVLQAFVQACFALVETSDAEAMSKAAGNGNAPLEAQVCRLTSLKRLSLACEVAVLLEDWDIVPRGVWRCYHLLLPLLGVPAMGRILFQVLCQLHQCLSLVPRDSWDRATKTTFACLAYQITIKGHEIGESPAAQTALLENGPEMDSATAENVVYKGGPSDTAGEEESSSDNGDVPQQLALLEVWMGLPGHCTDREKGSLRAALALRDAASTNRCGEANERGGEDQSSPVSVPSTLEAVEQVMSAAIESPAKAWELLKGHQFAGHPERIRLLCRVCRIALGRGMANEVISWLDSTAVGHDTGADDDGGGGATSRTFIFSVPDLEPLTAKVLADEGTLATLPYVSPARPEQATAEELSVGNGGGGQADSDVIVSGDGETKAQRRSSATTEGQSEGSSAGDAPREGPGALRATSAASQQLLWLAEVEHILGTASLQLAFAARNPCPSSAPSTLPNDYTPGAAVPPASVPTVSATSRQAAGGRRVWGYGSGPFAEVSATGPDIFALNGRTDVSEGGRGGATDGSDEDENLIVEKLEDDGTPWPTMDDVATAATYINVDSDTGKCGEPVDRETKEDSDGTGVDNATFALQLSKGIVHLTRAASRSRWGHSLVKTESACGLLWNAILSLWLSPQDFRPGNAACPGETGTAGVVLMEPHARVYAKACEALLDAFDTSRGGDGFIRESEPGNAVENFGKVRDVKSEHDPKGQARTLIRGSEGRGNHAADMLWVSRFVEWGLQGIVRCRCWGVAVKVGTRMLASAGGLHGGHRMYPLVTYAQKQLCSLASKLLTQRETRLQILDEEFIAAQAKRRRRKVLKAVETKSKEEIEHERNREPLMVAVGDARVRKQIHDHRLGTLLQSRDTYLKTKKIGRSSLDDAREALSEYLALLSPTPESESFIITGREGIVGGAGGGEATAFSAPEKGDGTVGAPTVDLDKSLKAVLKLYGRAVDVLRDKQERELLTEALCDLGDLHVLHGRYDLATRSWTDAIDGLCSALDSAKHWQVLFDRLRAAHPSSGGPPGGGGSLALALGGWSCLAGGTVLGKLSIFTGQADMNGQVNLCLMAAEMFRAPLEISLPFPQRECDYASYTPESLGGPGLEGLGLWTDDRRLSASALYASLMHVQGILASAGRFKEAFPVLAVLEHVALRVTLDPLHLARVKLARAECLTAAGFPAEAASALAAVLTGGNTPTTIGEYAGRRSPKEAESPPPPPPPAAEGKGKGKGASKDKGKGKGDTGKAKGKKGPPDAGDVPPAKTDGKELRDRRQLAASGLPFYGLAPYQNHLPLDHPENAAAVAWLTGDGVDGVEDDRPVGGGDPEGDGSARTLSRHARLLKRGLFGVNSALTELHGEREACLVARARARLLLALAHCSALPGVRADSTMSDAGDEHSGEAVVRRVRDSADCILGEVLQVVMKCISPAAIPEPPSQTLDSGRSGKSGAQGSSVGGSVRSASTTRKAGAGAGDLAVTASGGADAWAPPMAAETLLMRGQLALLDGKLRVCRHHASRGLAVLLRHGMGCCSPAIIEPHFPTVGTSYESRDGGNAGVREVATTVTFGDEQNQPWRTIQIWLELRHDLAAVALLQGRTKDAIFQIEKGLEEAKAVGEVIMSSRLRRLRAQAAVAEGELELAVSYCHALSSEYLASGALALDHAAVLRLLSKVRREQSLVCGGDEQQQALLFLSDALEALRLADSALLSATKDLGWIGSGLLTYAHLGDNIMMADAQPRLLHALGTSFRHLPHHMPEDVAFGLAPTDEDDAIAPSPLANLYLPTLRLLLAVRVSLLDVMEGMGHYNAALVQTGRNASESADKESYDERADQVIISGTVGSGERDEWLSTASYFAEETAALMRHAANPHPALRAHALLLIGKLRLRRLQSLRKSNGGSRPIKLMARLAQGTEMALSAALRVSFSRGGHDWSLMGDACMALVLLYVGVGDDGKEVTRGDQTSGAGDTKEDRGEAAPNGSKKLQLVSHYLRLAASISSGRRRLDLELDSIAVEPLPPAVIDAMPRSALDELAGRGGRGPEDDPLRLSARGLMQFLRARIREKSLAAAPADLLPASVICQIHALLYQHAPVYREKCCINGASLEPPSTEAGETSSSDVPPFTICAQWTWDSTLAADKAPGIGAEAGHGGLGGVIHPVAPAGANQGLFPTRTAVFLFGGVHAAHGGLDGDSPCVVMVQVVASKLEHIRRCASHLKALLSAFQAKSQATDTISLTLKERFDGLLRDTSAVLASARVASRLQGPSGPALSTREAGLASDANSEAPVGDPHLTIANVEALQGVFDTNTGVNIENEEICRFLRAATAG